MGVSVTVRLKSLPASARSLSPYGPEAIGRAAEVRARARRDWSCCFLHARRGLDEGQGALHDVSAQGEFLVLRR